MGETNKTCPIDGRPLHSNSGLYQGTSYDCDRCGASYDPYIDLEGQAKEYLDSLRSEAEIWRTEFEKRENKLERVVTLATKNGLLE